MVYVDKVSIHHSRKGGLPCTAIKRSTMARKLIKSVVPCAASSDYDASSATTPPEGASTNVRVIADRVGRLARPFWIDNPERKQPLLALGGVVVLSLMTTGVSVVFNFLGRDFFNALSNKDEATFYVQLGKYLTGFAIGIPVFVFRDYFLSLLSLRWRAWMTEEMLGSYMADRTFYNIASGAAVDNPDQRLTSDISAFTSTSLSLSFTLLTSLVDLISFSGILFSIYPPLFAALVFYAIGGTVASFYIGRKLVGLNFEQEAREADLRYGLVRVRENAESIAFYNGASSEVGLLAGRLGKVVSNYRGLVAASRNLDFFQSAYRYIIILLPAAVVAPLYFKGEIEFGVINQSQSAFSHILSDVSLVVYQFEALAGYSAVVDRLGQFQEAVDARGKIAADGDAEDLAMDPTSEIELVDVHAADSAGALVQLEGVTICTPTFSRTLVRGLSLQLPPSGSLLVMGPSGCGKTSLLRAIGGLWTSGAGSITRPSPSDLQGDQGAPGGMMLVPQKPYMALGSLRQQLLYPVFADAIIAEALNENDTAYAKQGLLDFPVAPHVGTADGGGAHADAAHGAGERGSRGSGEGGGRHGGVGLQDVVARCAAANDGSALSMVADWSARLSLGEQQRLAFARVLLAAPALVLLDESTSALDLANEARLYGILRERGVAYISVGHRDSLRGFHDDTLVLEAAEAVAEPVSAEA
eukprot:jgi/Ulvmu1/6547/UM003_0181.1